MTRTTRNKLGDNLPEVPDPPDFLIQLPCPIEADWHERWGPLLAGFPVELVYVGVLPSNDATKQKVRYSLDLSSFSEDDSRKRVRYILSQPSDYYVEVVWRKKTGCWETSKYKGTRLIALADGRSFEGAMIQTLLIGLQPDEPAE